MGVGDNNMANKSKQSKFKVDSDKILLECLANIKKSMRDYEKHVQETIEEVKFSLATDNE
jgi:hypothetical protein